MPALVDIRACAKRIEALQQADGALPWIEAGIWDAWNHGESAMGLAIAGRQTAALRALDCLVERQEADGGWSGDLGASVPLDDTNRHLLPGRPARARDTNFTGYAAVTVLRSLLALQRLDLAPRYWPMIAAAMDFVLHHQTPHGDIVWRAPEGSEAIDSIDSLRAGNSSLYKALECAILLGRLLDQRVDHWAAARRRIGAALREHDARFDRTGTDRRRFAMDWYYPVLAGVVAPESGQARLYARWSEFVSPGLGCRCVSDEPWVTAAETAELALACLAARKPAQARELIANLAPLAARDGGYWMGWQFEEEIIWPQERPAWTAGALVLAADALDRLTPGHDLLVRNWVRELPVSRSAEALPAFLSD
ncbi:prenyltransferase/squalene oxidase repeat-containing protein [Maricaulis sp. CAU 1757]